MLSTLLSKPVPANMANFTFLHRGALGFQMISSFLPSSYCFLPLVQCARQGYPTFILPLGVLLAQMLICLSLCYSCVSCGLFLCAFQLLFFQINKAVKSTLAFSCLLIQRVGIQLVT